MILPTTAALAAAFLGVMQIILMMTVGNKRRATSISLGDGGDADMLRVTRRHGNFIENAPMFLILLMLFEILGGAQTIVIGFAILFIVTRISHAISLSSAETPLVFRATGALGTLISFIGLSGFIAWTVLSNGAV
jgi:uncharacterized membrane protein YecN with MAPEG domain